MPLLRLLHQMCHMQRTRGGRLTRSVLLLNDEKNVIFLETTVGVGINFTAFKPFFLARDKTGIDQ